VWAKTAGLVVGPSKPTRSKNPLLRLIQPLLPRLRARPVKNYEVVQDFPTVDHKRIGAYRKPKIRVRRARGMGIVHDYVRLDERPIGSFRQPAISLKRVRKTIYGYPTVDYRPIGYYPKPKPVKRSKDVIVAQSYKYIRERKVPEIKTCVLTKRGVVCGNVGEIKRTAVAC
jgi:hypothetical protein